MFSERERMVELWFLMWLKQTDMGIEHIFSENCTYVESWGPKYEGVDAVKHWFQEYHTRGRGLSGISGSSFIRINRQLLSGISRMR